MAINLRGIRESGTFFAIPTYAFMVAILGMCAYGLLRARRRRPARRWRAPSLHIEPAPGYGGSMTTLALMFLLARAFSSGCAALTGVEAISNGVPAFRKPKSKNAATTLLLLGMIAITMMLSVITLAKQMGLQLRRPRAAGPAARSTATPVPADYDQHPVDRADRPGGVRRLLAGLLRW